MEQVHKPEFEAEIEIGHRFRHIDRHATATIDGGALTICGHGGDVIAHAELHDVWAHPSRGSLKIWFDGQHYTLSAGRELNTAFMDVARMEGAHIGKP